MQASTKILCCLRVESSRPYSHCKSSTVLYSIQRPRRSESRRVVHLWGHRGVATCHHERMCLGDTERIRRQTLTQTTEEKAWSLVAVAFVPGQRPTLKRPSKIKQALTMQVGTTDKGALGRKTPSTPHACVGLLRTGRWTRRPDTV